MMPTNNDVDIQKGFQAQLKTDPNTMNVKLDDPSMQSAWQLGKDRANAENINPTQNDYWDKVTGYAKQSLGLNLDQTNSTRSIPPTPVAKINQPSGSYPRYGEKKSKKTADDHESDIEYGCKIELAKEVIKDLKAAKVSEDNIIHSLVNRLSISPDDAKALYDGKYECEGEPFRNIPESVMDEDDEASQTSDAFEATPFDAKHKFKDDGDKVNKQACDSLKKMGIKEHDYSKYRAFDNPNGTYEVYNEFGEPVENNIDADTEEEAIKKVQYHYNDR
jgi:hypothetical protein